MISKVPGNTVLLNFNEYTVPLNSWTLISQYSCTQAMDDLLNDNLDESDERSILELTKQCGFKA